MWTRTIPAPELTLWRESGQREYRGRIRRRGDVAWTDLSNTLGGDWLLGVRADINTPDQPAASFDLRLIRRAAEGTLSPGISAAPINQDAQSELRPLLHPGREVEVHARIKGGSYPWRLWLKGEVATAEWPDDEVLIRCRTMDGVLLRAQITEEVERGADDPGVPLATEIQGLLDEYWPGADVPVLRVIGDPELGIGRYKTPIGSLGAHIRTLAQRIGWDVRYLWSEPDQAYRLTLYLPPRDKTTPDFLLPIDEVADIPALSQSDEWTRNAIIVPHVTEVGGAEQRVVVEDAASIAEYRRQPMVVPISEGNRVPATTQQATAFGNYALHDLGRPLVEARYRHTRCLPWLELHDVIAVQADGARFDQDRIFSVVGGSHEVTADGEYTDLELRGGSPAGAVFAWWELAGVDPRQPAPANPDILAVNRISETATEIVYRVLRGAAVHVADVHWLITGPRITDEDRESLRSDSYRRVSLHYDGDTFAAPQPNEGEVLMILVIPRGRGVNGMMGVIGESKEVVVYGSPARLEAAASFARLSSDTERITLRLTDPRGVADGVHIYETYRGSTSGPHIAVEAESGVYAHTYTLRRDHPTYLRVEVLRADGIPPLVLHYMADYDEVPRAPDVYEIAIAGGVMLYVDAVDTDAASLWYRRVEDDLPLAESPIPLRGADPRFGAMTVQYEDEPQRYHIYARNPRGVPGEYRDYIVTRPQQPQPPQLSARAMYGAAKDTADVHGTVRAEGSEGITLRAWVRKHAYETPDPSGPPDGTVWLPSTPATFGPGTNFGDAGELLNEIRSHPAEPKTIYLEAVTADGRTSGVVAVALSTRLAGLINELGELEAESSFTWSSMLPGLRPPLIFPDAAARTAATGLVDVGRRAFQSDDLSEWIRTSSGWALEQFPRDQGFFPILTAGAVRAAALHTEVMSAVDFQAEQATIAYLESQLLAAITAQVGTLSELAPDMGIIVSGQLRNASGTRVFDLDASGSDPILRAGNWLQISEGDAQFGGRVTVNSQTQFETGYNPATNLQTALQADAAILASAQDYVDDAIDTIVMPSGGNIIIASQVSPTTRPGGAPLVIGDVWLKSDEGNLPHAMTGWTGPGGATPVWTRMYTQIDGGHIRTGTVDASKIGANAVTAGKLAVGWAPGSALNSDPNATDAGAWEHLAFLAPRIVSVSGGAVGPTAVANQVGQTSYVFDRARIPIDHTKTYRASAWARRMANSPAGPFYLVIVLRDEAGNRIDGASAGWWHYVQGATSLNTTFQHFGGTFGADTSNPFPASARTMQIGMFLNPGPQEGQVYAQGIRLEEVLPSVLIKDGAITANKVAANAVTADKINVGALSAITGQLGTVYTGMILDRDLLPQRGILFSSGQELPPSVTDYINLTATGVGHILRLGPLRLRANGDFAILDEVTKTVRYSHYAFRPSTSTDQYTTFAQSTGTTDALVVFGGAVTLPAGVTVSRLSFRGNRNHASNQITCTLKRVVDGSGEQTLASVSIVPTSGTHNSQVLLEEVVQADATYVVQVQAQSGSALSVGFEWVELEYTSHNYRQTQ